LTGCSTNPSLPRLLSGGTPRHSLGLPVTAVEVHGNLGCGCVGFALAGAMHEGKGEAAVVIDERATESRGALLRILTGHEPGATVCCVQIATRSICSSPRHPI
jgi:hypothetical protein